MLPGLVTISGAAIAGALGGLGIGRARRAFSCSAEHCDAHFDRRATICPGCGGAITGEITVNERLEMIDELHREQEEEAEAALEEEGWRLEEGGIRR